MNLRNLAITFVLVIACANALLLLAPPQPALTIGALAIGAVVGLGVSRFVMLPAIAKYTAE